MGRKQFEKAVQLLRMAYSPKPSSDIVQEDNRKGRTYRGWTQGPQRTMNWEASPKENNWGLIKKHSLPQGKETSYLPTRISELLWTVAMYVSHSSSFWMKAFGYPVPVQQCIMWKGACAAKNEHSRPATTLLRNVLQGRLFADIWNPWISIGFPPFFNW